MKDIRVRALILKENFLILIRRIKSDREYYVFPGGGVENNEGLERALLRECYEELSVKINIVKPVYELETEKNIQKFYLCSIIGGVICKGNGPEFISHDIERGVYIPCEINIDKIFELPLFPLEIRDRFLIDHSKYENPYNIPFKKIYGK